MSSNREPQIDGGARPRGPERERDLPRDAYFSEEYFTYPQLWSFVDQIYHIRRLASSSMVEVGVGNGIVSSFFRAMGLRVKTFDINPRLKPDVVAPVDKIGDFVAPAEFDLISCCEVLEHMPFDEFETVIRSFSHLSDNLFLTLPVHGRSCGFGGNVRLPRCRRRWIGIWFRLPPTRRRPVAYPHLWEVDYESRTRKAEILRILRSHYEQVETGLFKANPRHRYFACRGAKGLHSMENPDTRISR